MPKGVVVAHNGKVSSFQIEKVERAKLYGVRRRLAIDEEGRTCARAALTDDGEVLLRAGMMAQGWFDTDGLTYDFLHGLAKSLDEADEMVLLGAGESGRDPVVFQTNGLPWRGFLEGRVDGVKYQLLLRLSNLELKKAGGA